MNCFFSFHYGYYPDDNRDCGFRIITLNQHSMQIEIYLIGFRYNMAWIRCKIYAYGDHLVLPNEIELFRKDIRFSMACMCHRFIIIAVNKYYCFFSGSDFKGIFLKIFICRKNNATDI